MAVVAVQTAKAVPHIPFAASDSGSAMSSISIEDSLAFPRGISTTFGRMEYYSSLSNYNQANYEFFIGLGYNITPQYLAGLRVYTGSESVIVPKAYSFLGPLAVGGVALELRYRFTDAGKWRPTIAATGELVTLLTGGENSGDNSTGSGYNGKAVGAQAGIEYYLNRNFAFSLNAIFKYQTYHDLILGGNFSGTPNVGIDRFFGLTLSTYINYNLLP
jgi:hypothetical protein